MTSARKQAITILIFAAIALVAAVAGGVTRRRNVARQSLYEHDPSCRAALISPTPGGTRCVAEVATIPERWSSSFENSTYYHLALRTADGVVDSVELEGLKDDVAWNATAPLHEILVQRFHEGDVAHVTLVQTGMLAVRTQWNPGWRGDDAMAGAVFFGLIALGLGVWGFVLMRRD